MIKYLLINLGFIIILYPIALALNFGAIEGVVQGIGLTIITLTIQFSTNHS